MKTSNPDTGVWWCERPGHSPRVCQILDRLPDDTEAPRRRAIDFLDGASFWFDQWKSRHAPEAVFTKIDSPDKIAENTAKLSERKTIHEWLNQLGIPDTEVTGRRMCLFRRLAVAFKISPYEAT